MSRLGLLGRHYILSSERWREGLVRVQSFNLLNCWREIKIIAFHSNRIKRRGRLIHELNPAQPGKRDSALYCWRCWAKIRIGTQIEIGEQSSQTLSLFLVCGWEERCRFRVCIFLPRSRWNGSGTTRNLNVDYSSWVGTSWKSGISILSRINLWTLRKRKQNFRNVTNCKLCYARWNKITIVYHGLTGTKVAVNKIAEFHFCGKTILSDIKAAWNSLTQKKQAYNFFSGVYWIYWPYIIVVSTWPGGIIPIQETGIKFKQIHKSTKNK